MRRNNLTLPPVGFMLDWTEGGIQLRCDLRTCTWHRRVPDFSTLEDVNRLAWEHLGLHQEGIVAPQNGASSIQ